MWTLVIQAKPWMTAARSRRVSNDQSSYQVLLLLLNYICNCALCVDTAFAVNQFIGPPSIRSDGPNNIPVLGFIVERHTKLIHALGQFGVPEGDNIPPQEQAEYT